VGRAEAAADPITASRGLAKTFSRRGTSLNTARHFGQLTRIGLDGKLESDKKNFDAQLSH
jgi:hypothetical protein